MFTLFYLEIIQQTKLAANKRRHDQNLGHQINCTIGAFYTILFLIIFIVQSKQPKTINFDKPDDPSTELSYEMVIKNWYRTPDPFQSVPKT